MKKALIILLAAALATTAGSAAACSKGQTGGGNNTMSGFTRTAENSEGNENPEDNAGEENDGNVEEGDKHCPDCGKGKHKGRKGRHKQGMMRFIFEMPTDGAAGFARRKPAPIPPAPVPPVEEGEENGGTDEEQTAPEGETVKRTTDNAENGNGKSKLPAPGKGGNKGEGVKPVPRKEGKSAV